MNKDDIVKQAISTLHEYCIRNNIKSLKRQDKIIMYLDESGDNHIVWEPRFICIPCLHDPVEQEKTQDALKQRFEKTNEGDKKP